MHFGLAHDHLKAHAKAHRTTKLRSTLGSLDIEISTFNIHGLAVKQVAPYRQKFVGGWG
ncbi:hypothetical protein FHW67_000877 [Herbaspirillum sp. Sphag1AN]|nr:hypothetical protein [Herbaspirillum sp. Sphag1AN]MBB3245103.1 hypothetical protein [Herbaspirillum sp. Sphag64]